MIYRLALLFAVLLCLESCIPVDDFGGYWDKATRDPSLAGKWVRLAQPLDPGGPKAAGQILAFLRKQDAYEILDHAKPAEAPLYPVKTIHIGSYDFLAMGREKGLLVRYKQQHERLQFCDNYGPRLVNFFSALFPKASSITRNKGEGEYPVVHLLDDEAFKMLSSVPDTQEYWTCDMEFQRIH